MWIYGKGEEVLKKLLHAAAVLALLTGTIAVAQIGGTVGGGISGGGVGGPIDRGFSTAVGGRFGVSGGAGSRTQSHAAASSWAPTKNMLTAESSEKAADANQRAKAEGQVSYEQPSNKKELTKQGAGKKTGVMGGSGSPSSTSSFGGLTRGASTQVGFSGRLMAGGGSGGSERDKADEAKFARASAAHGGSSRGGGRKHRRGRSYMPKLKSPEGNGPGSCDGASSLHLCNWL
jgi:hypothetical protein